MNKGFVKNFLPDYTFPNVSMIKDYIFTGSDLIIFDVDNTLVFPETLETKKEIRDWFNNTKSKYRCVCVSNSRTIRNRAMKLKKLLGCNVLLGEGKKPLKRLFKQIVEKSNFPSNKVVVVGDRIFTDVLFGNSNGAITILVEPLTPKENILIKITRKLENFIHFFLKFFI